MSRSRKKTPIIAIACHGKGSMAKWKKECNRSIRRQIQQTEELPQGKIYRRMIERWTAPDDGKQYWDNPKAYRK